MSANAHSTEGIIPTQLESEVLSDLVARAALEFKAIDLAIIDLRGIVDFTDIFVVCSASNPRQARAIAQGVKGALKDSHTLYPNSIEGLEGCKWVLVDYGDVILHVFDGPMRGFYDLDGLWQDAPRLESPEVDVAPESEPLFTLS